MIDQEYYAELPIETLGEIHKYLFREIDRLSEREEIVAKEIERRMQMTSSEPVRPAGTP